MRTAPYLLTGLLALSLTAPALAHKDAPHGHGQGQGHKHEHDHGHDSLGSHQHGVGQLNVVVEGGRVEIELESPADNLVGFEYLPRTEEDRARVRRVQEQLEDSGALFRFPDAASCSPLETELSSPLFAALENHTDHDHDHKHDHDTAAHNDIEAQYSFQCASPAALDQMEVLLFERFPGTERLVLQAIGDGGQRGGELTATQNIIRF